MLCPKHAYYAYAQTMVSTVDHPLEPIIILYENTIESLNRALSAIKAKDINAKIKHTERAITIIEGLLNSLNMESGGEIALNLEGLYVYMIRELTLANLKNDGKRIEQIIPLLKELKEAWVQIKTDYPNSE
ncbi:MAG: flagellar export chaperone FliS [Thermoproteota archaeon]